MHTRKPGSYAKNISFKLSKTNYSEIVQKRKQLYQIKNDYADFLKNPEKQKNYESEWKIFWERRYFELVKEGRNPDTHDFQKEWIDFWYESNKERYKKEIKMLEGEIEAIKKRSSELIEISSESSEDDHRKEIKRRKGSYSRSPSRSSSSRHYSPISQSSNDRKYSRKNSYSSISSDSEDFSSRSRDNSHAKEVVSLVSVLRILSALDAELGNILASKVIDLLAKSLELEKVKPNSSEEVLMTSENVIFLETVKEKLKGMLSVDLIGSKKVYVAKKCIQNIAQLIHQNSLIVSRTKVLNSNDPNVKIAQMIANELRKQGREETTPEELEVLVDVYLEELSKQNDKKSESEEHPCPKSNAFESLTDSDLKVLISNFSQLKDDEQHDLIEYLSRLEKNQPERISNLKEAIESTFLEHKKASQATSDNNNNEDSDFEYNPDEFLKSIFKNISKPPEHE